LSEDLEMKIYEIIVENELDEGRLNFSTRDARKVLNAIGYSRREGSSHELWNKAGEVPFPLSRGSGDLVPKAASQLLKLMKKYNYDPSLLEEPMDEAVGLPGDTSTLLSLLGEMANMLGAGGPQHSEGPLRTAVMQVFNNGSAEDAEGFEKQLNFRLGSVRSMWMGKNWPQLKSCFLRLKKEPKYQRSIKVLDALGDWPVKLIKDPKDPSLSKYFSSIIELSPSILTDIARFDPEDHVRQRAKHMAGVIRQRAVAFNQFKAHWTSEYEKETAPPKDTPKPKDGLSGKQAAGAEDIINKVLSAVPPNVAKEIRPQIARMGSQNEKLMFIMQALQKAGIDPHKVLG